MPAIISNAKILFHDQNTPFWTANIFVTKNSFPNMIGIMTPKHCVDIFANKIDKPAIYISSLQKLIKKYTIQCLDNTKGVSLVWFHREETGDKQFASQYHSVDIPYLAYESSTWLYSSGISNFYGHVGQISELTETEVEIMPLQSISPLGNPSDYGAGWYYRIDEKQKILVAMDIPNETNKIYPLRPFATGLLLKPIFKKYNLRLLK